MAPAIARRPSAPPAAPRVARDRGHNLQAGGPQLAQRRGGPVPAPNPVDRLTNQAQQLVNRDPKGELGPAKGGVGHLVQGLGWLQVAASRLLDKNASPTVFF